MHTRLYPFAVFASVFVLGLGLHPRDARAGLIGTTVTITSDSSFSGDPQSIDVVVVEGVAEVPNGFGTSATLSYQTAIDIEATTIRVELTSYMGLGYTPFQGLRFSNLASPGEVIVGFSVTSNIQGVEGAFLASAVSFTADSLSIDFQNGQQQTWRRNDWVEVALQFGPSAAVPEPATFAMLGVGMLPIVALARRRLVG